MNKPNDFDYAAYTDATVAAGLRARLPLQDIAPYKMIPEVKVSQ